MAPDRRLEFVEGEDVLLPCRSCEALALTVTVRASTRTPQCSKCGALTKVQIQRVGRRWEILTAPAPVREGLEGR